MASSSAPLRPLVEAPAEDPKQDLLKQIRSHEVALAELNCLPPSRKILSDSLFLNRSKHLLQPVSINKPRCSFHNNLEAVYQRNGNIFFRKNVKAAAALEQKQLNSAMAQLQKLSTV